jgi:hypothetical protein
MIEKEKLYGIVVFYNPSDEDIQKIESYINDIKHLIIRKIAGLLINYK